MQKKLINRKKQNCKRTHGVFSDVCSYLSGNTTNDNCSQRQVSENAKERHLTSAFEVGVADNIGDIPNRQNQTISLFLLYVLIVQNNHF